MNRKILYVVGLAILLIIIDVAFQFYTFREIASCHAFLCISPLDLFIVALPVVWTFFALNLLVPHFEWKVVRQICIVVVTLLLFAPMTYLFSVPSKYIFS